METNCRCHSVDRFLWRGGVFPGSGPVMHLITSFHCLIHTTCASKKIACLFSVSSPLGSWTMDIFHPCRTNFYAPFSAKRPWTTKPFNPHSPIHSRLRHTALLPRDGIRTHSRTKSTSSRCAGDGARSQHSICTNTYMCIMFVTCGVWPIHCRGEAQMGEQAAGGQNALMHATRSTSQKMRKRWHTAWILS